MQKTYIGDVEALEIAFERGCELPHKGFENHTVHAIATGLPVQILGKDCEGFYLTEYDGNNPPLELFAATA
jgi:hypothetical protein